MQRKLPILMIILLAYGTTFGQVAGGKGFLVRVADSATGQYGYRNHAGTLIIPLGKYAVCYTDTFRYYAVVFKPGQGIVGIDRHENVLYHVFIFDNGPDEPQGRLFRIQVDGKIGFADAVTGKVIIPPRFACAWPFDKGRAKVAFDCQMRKDGEYHIWISDHWFYIDAGGRRL